MNAHDTMQARQAALLVYGLPAEARQQVIAKLSIAESSRLQRLLSELADLGVSPSVGRRLHRLASLPSSPAPTLTMQQKLEQFGAEEVAHCLESYGPATAAQLLRAGSELWRNRVLDYLSFACRTKVIEHLRRESPPLAPAVRCILGERLSAQVARISAARFNVDESPADLLPSRGWVALVAGIKAGAKRVFTWMR